MKKTLIAIVLAAFCFSVPVFANARGATTPTPAELTRTANSTVVPMFAQVRIQVGGRHRRRRFVGRRWGYRRYHRYRRFRRG